MYMLTGGVANGIGDLAKILAALSGQAECSFKCPNGEFTALKIALKTAASVCVDFLPPNILQV